MPLLIAFVINCFFPLYLAVAAAASHQVDSLEQALLAALPLGPQAAAGGISLPELFRVS
jgi:hypothetical protein